MAMAAAEVFDPTALSRSPLPVTRRKVQDAVAKAVELRALHTALRQRGAPSAGASRSPATIRLPPAASPALSGSAAAADEDEDYPVFTPAYDEESMAGLNDISQDNNRSRSENWSGITLDRGGGEDAFSDSGNPNVFSSSTSEAHYFPSSNDHHRSRGGYRIHPAFLQSAPLAGGRFAASAGRAELKVPASCSSFRPATIGRDHDGTYMGGLRFLSSSRAPLSSSSYQPSSATAKHKGSQIISWLFGKTKKKPKASRTAIERENMSQLLKEWGLLSLDSLRKELADANARRDAAKQEAAEVSSAMGELTTKLLNLEGYCSELKKALRQATNNGGGGGSRSIGSSRDLSSMPVSHEAMVEGFLQIASEARLSVKQFCKALIQQVEEPDNGLSDKLNLLLQPYHLTIAGGHNHCYKTTLHHLESLMNQSMHEEFENRTFLKNGSPRWLDPKQERHENFVSFVALRNLSWNEVLRKGTKFYSEEFSRFCDQKMSCVVSMLDWAWPWPEHLLQCFFVATKCVWLLHLLAFSFSPPLPILRVQENRVFDPMYMEDILLNKHQLQSPSRVKIMVMPGFYVQDRVLKCKILTTRSEA